MQEYPKLLWLKDGREVTAGSKAEEDALRKDGARGAPPGQEEPKPAAEAVTAKAEPADADLTDDDVASHGGRKKK